MVELVEAGSERAEIDMERIQTELVRHLTSDTRVALTSTGGLIDPQYWDDDFATTISSIEVVTNSGNQCKYEEGCKSTKSGRQLLLQLLSFSIVSLCQHQVRI